MPFNIDEFKAKVSTGLLRNNKFTLSLETIPHGMVGTKYATQFPDLKFYCESVDIPGTLLSTHENYRRYGYGPVEKKPYMPTYPDCRAVFRSDQDGLIFGFIRQWIALAVNYQFRNTDVGNPSVDQSTVGINDKSGWTNLNTGIGGNATKALTPYELGYKRQYAVDILISMYSEDGNSCTMVSLRDAYPVLASDMPLAWQMTKTYAQLPVAFAFTDLSSTTFRKTASAQS